MNFRILGPVEVLEDGRVLAIGRGRELALLALLLLHRNQPVAVDAMIEALWGDRPPATAPKIVQNYVLRLRKTLGQDRVVTQGGGYTLNVETGELDADEAEALVVGARTILLEGRPADAERDLSRALGLWRGRPLAEFAYESFTQNEIDRLDELRLSAIEERNDALLALGRHDELTPELERLVADEPFRERLRAQLMLALYRAGRQADALEVYGEGRRRLHDEHGLEPTEPLRALQRRILNQDPELAAAPFPSPRPRARGVRVRWRGAVPFAAVVVVAVVVGAVLAFRPSMHRGMPVSRLSANTLARIDPRSGTAVATYPTGDTPRSLAVSGSSAWVANFHDRTVSRIDLSSKSTKTTGIGAAPERIAVGENGVWVISSFNGEVVRISPETASPIADVREAPGLTGLAVGAGGVWVTNEEGGTVTRIDPRTTEPVATIRGLRGPAGIAVGGGAVWVAEERGKSVVKIDPRTNSPSLRIPLALAPRDVAFGGGALWVTNPKDNVVTRIDRFTLQPDLISVGNAPSAVAADARAAWVVNDIDHTVLRIDAKSGSVGRRLVLSHRGVRDTRRITPGGVAVANGSLWIAIDSY
jgi:DNA-binding SARP family transcriptional activator/streptogramin lyase